MIVNAKLFSTHFLVALLVLALTFPAASFGQSSGTSPDSRTATGPENANTGTGAANDSGSPREFSKPELDQMIAPIALYPDALLAQILVAATYPEQVEEANQWVKTHGDLEGDPLNAALDKMNWDLSVKALVPFPKVLDMMSAEGEWTQKLGEAFLAQQEDVMGSVQRLRARARAQGNLKSTAEQRVAVKGDSIEIAPANPESVYIPTYNPGSVYGSWGYPDYPPYAYSPYYPRYVYDPSYVVPGIIVAGALGFAAAVAVGGFWHRGWGYWDWGHRRVFVNVHRTININRTYINRTTVRTTNFNTAVRQGRIGSPSVRQAARLRTINRPTATSVERGLHKGEATTRTERGKASRTSSPASRQINRPGSRAGHGKAVVEPRGGKASRQVSPGRPAGPSRGTPAGISRGHEGGMRVPGGPGGGPGKAPHGGGRGGGGRGHDGGKEGK
jgi:hypothetical protein